jgi:hypothetical protein
MSVAIAAYDRNKVFGTFKGERDEAKVMGNPSQQTQRIYEDVA